jgi:hypothetical protein
MFVAVPHCFEGPAEQQSAGQEKGTPDHPVPDPGKKLGGRERFESEPQKKCGERQKGGGCKDRCGRDVGGIGPGGVGEILVSGV